MCFVVAPGILEGILGKIIADTLHVRGVLFDKPPCSILYGYFAIGIWPRCRKFLITDEVREERRVVIWSEHCTKLLQISQERCSFVVVNDPAEGVQPSLAFLQKPVLFQSLAGCGKGLAHADTTILLAR
jgi:hypothetical protein